MSMMVDTAARSMLQRYGDNAVAYARECQNTACAHPSTPDPNSTADYYDRVIARIRELRTPPEHDQ